MARRRSSRYGNNIRLRGIERVLMILGATIYVVGMLGGFHFLPMPDRTAILLLIVGGGLLLVNMLGLVF